ESNFAQIRQEVEGGPTANFDALQKSIKSLPIPDEKGLDELLGRMTSLNALPEQLHVLQLEAIQHFLQVDIPNTKAMKDSKCLVPLEVLSCMQGKGSVAEGLRRSVNGFVMASTYSTTRLHDLEWMAKSDRSLIEEIHFNHPATRMISSLAYVREAKRFAQLFQLSEMDAVFQLFTELKIFGFLMPFRGDVIDGDLRPQRVIADHNALARGMFLENLLGFLQDNPHTKKIQLLRLFMDDKGFHEEGGICAIILTPPLIKALRNSCPIIFDFPVRFISTSLSFSFKEEELSDFELVKQKMHELDGLQYYEFEKDPLTLVKCTAKRSAKPIVFKERAEGVARNEAASLDDADGSYVPSQNFVNEYGVKLDKMEKR
ncbi:MAG TPA: hypothetical protein VN457_06500, partial [Chlamydiales bacterium]|nr:hypothetical protein [Chlamydiales bacterium]